MLLRLKGGGHSSSRRGLRVAGERLLLQQRLAAGSYCVTSRQGTTFLLRAVVAGRQAMREVGGQQDRQTGSQVDRKLGSQYVGNYVGQYGQYGSMQYAGMQGRNTGSQ